MNLRLRSVWARFLPLGFLLGGAACGAGGGAGQTSMFISSCSLQCTDSAGSPGAQISCGVTDVFVNQEIRIAFSNPVDKSSATSNSFIVTESGTGKTPPGSFTLDPTDDRILIYRPQLTFDSAGNPIFGLTEDKTYFFKIPGTALDPLGPYIRNSVGAANASRMQCTLIASRGVFDAKVGRPRVTVTIDRVTGYDANGVPNAFEFDRPAAGAVDVYRGSPVRMVFDDVMDPRTLANRVTGESDFIKVLIDPDGDTLNSGDQVAVVGSFELTIDQNALRTTALFHPSGGFPSAGSSLTSRRKVVVDLSALIADLGGQALLNPGTTSFTPEVIQFEPLVLVESFNDVQRQDEVRSGSQWGGGNLGTGPGGGSGRLGDLVVVNGQVVELNTDFEDFAGITSLATFNPNNVIERPTPLQITDGIFEFSRLRVDAGGVLRFRGSNPARIYVRGVASIQGLIDVSATSGTLHDSTSLAGAPGGIPGPNGGIGGQGGKRPDGSAFLGAAGGVANPGAGPSDVLDPAAYDLVNGGDGGGIPFPSTIDPSPSFVGGGGGSLAWPQPTTINPTLHMPSGPEDVLGLQVEVYQECRYAVPSAPGGGGANSFPGGIGVALSAGIPANPVTLSPDSPGGVIGPIDDTVRSLSPELGLLRGGAGGGGGGAHLQLTQINGLALVNCAIPIPVGNPLSIISYRAHSAAAGGGGGGALQVAAGNRITLGGVINASGGEGGSGRFPPRPQAPFELAQAGGGGAGGSVLLQSPQVIVQTIPKRIDVDGGVGGEGTGSPYPLQPSVGGRGSPGLLRIEARPAPLIVTEQVKVNPTEGQLQSDFGPSVTIEDIFTTAEWTPSTEAPSGWSGAQSCWIRPTGNFFRLDFNDDSAGLGWDMQLNIAGQPLPQSFRDKNFGVDFGTSPVIVRFQGARADRALEEPCSVPETGDTSPIAGGSMTDWVSHPSELNTFFTTENLTSNMFRFVILWDRSHPEFSQIEGVAELVVRIQPD